MLLNFFEDRLGFSMWFCLLSVCPSIWGAYLDNKILPHIRTLVFTTKNISNYTIINPKIWEPHPNTKRYLCTPNAVPPTCFALRFKRRSTQKFLPLFNEFYRRTVGRKFWSQLCFHPWGKFNPPRLSNDRIGSGELSFAWGKIPRERPELKMNYRLISFHFRPNPC